MVYLVIDKSTSIFGETIYQSESSSKVEKFCEEYKKNHSISKLTIVKSDLPIRR